MSGDRGRHVRGKSGRPTDGVEAAVVGKPETAFDAAPECAGGKERFPAVARFDFDGVGFEVDDVG